MPSVNEGDNITKDSKSNQEVVKHSYEEYVRDPIACGYTLIEEDGEQFYSKTIKHDNCTIILDRPVLTPEERKKREEHFAAVAESVLSEYYRRKAESKEE